SLKGLILEVVTLKDWEVSVKISGYGLLSSDALLVAVALRLGVPVYTFDRDFSRVPGLEVKP
ncbi:MAG: PIN domain-containing protein, partial [Candidatus Korarchaeota archaeon]|nr:PIN domain-containing protein [Candidatus Korarchaeota archaeon]